MCPVPAPQVLAAGPQPHLVADEKLTLPQRAGHIVDGQAQVVVTVLEVQDTGLLDQLSTKLLLQLHHFLQCPGVSGA